MIDKKPEVLAPAGDRERLEAALRFGADAVYLGGKLFNMRAGTRSFTQEELAEAVKLTHQMGKRLYLTCNTLLNNEEADLLPRYLAEVHEMGVDAAIVSDIGVLMAAHRAVPELELHISTQAGVTNWLTATELHRLGAKRVVLARELPLTEIEELCRRIPRELEVEVFVHGAMCMSVSGRCLLSQYLTGRDANRGACTQPCRWKYALMEEKRPGEYFPVFEDEKGTYILNSRDMCTIDHLKDLMDAGIDCIKIEGRAKSAYYAAIVTGAYRHCIDDVAAGREIDPIWRDEVEHVSHRIYSTGFYYGQPGQYVENSRYIRQWQIVARVEECSEDGLAFCSLNNKFSAGDALEVVGPDLRPFAVTAQGMRDADGMPLDEVRTPQSRFTLQLPKAVPPMSLLRRSVDLSAK